MREAVVVLPGSVVEADVSELCAQLGARLGVRGTGVVVCDVGALRRADAVTVEALARLQLTARRRGSRLVLRGARPDLVSLLALAGLDDVVGVPATSVQVRREAESGEEVGVEEIRDADDPSL